MIINFFITITVHLQVVTHTTQYWKVSITRNMSSWECVFPIITLKIEIAMQNKWEKKKRQSIHSHREREKKQVNGNLSIISNALRQEKLKKKIYNINLKKEEKEKRRRHKRRAAVWPESIFQKSSQTDSTSNTLFSRNSLFFSLSWIKLFIFGDGPPVLHP